MKIELKHYAAYLPYDLQVKDPETITPGVMVSICTGMIGLVLYERKDFIEYYEPEKVKMIIKPLSDLVPSDYGYVNQPVNGNLVDILIDHVKTGYITNANWQKMVKNKYDVYGLIPAGLAIDANTLK